MHERELKLSTYAVRTWNLPNSYFTFVKYADALSWLGVFREIKTI